MAALLAVIVVVACGLRVTNLDWDRGSHLHPDERFLTLVNEEISAPDGPAEYFDTARSPLNPANNDEWYVYGTAPLFLTKAVGTWLHDGAATGAQPARAVVVGLDRMGVDLLDRDGEPTFDGGYDSERIGRLLSALIDTLTALAVFELARLAGGRRAGLAGALVWATSVLAIQHAHFFVMEPLLVLATASVLVAAAHVALGRGRVVLALGAVAAGVAGASKVNGLLVVAVLVAAVMWKHYATVGTQRPTRRRRDAAIDVAIVAAFAFVTFRVLQPYAFDGLFSLDGGWLEAVRELSALQGGGDSPINVQWADRVPVIEPLWHLVRFGFGIPATVLVGAGVAGLVRNRRWTAWRNEPVRVLLVGWVLLCGLIVLPRWVTTMRYMLPAYPALAALAGIGAARLLRERGWIRWVAPALLAACVLWALAFTNGVYLREHPRITAAEWMVRNAPDGSVLSVDEWDDGLPFTPDDVAEKGFTSVVFTPFDTESPDDVRRLAADLDRVDYVVQSSDRVTGVIDRVPARYAPVLRYQRALEDGSLGFEPVATFATGPSLFGVGIDDTGSEEAFRVYDHPTVRIWHKSAAFSLVDALEVLQPDRAAASVHVPLDEAAANGLMLRRGAATDPGVSTGSTFDEVFWDRLPLAPLWWLAWWELTAFAALGWSARLFRTLPDRGIGLAKVLGPMAVVIPLWSAVAWGAVRFSAVTAAVATLSAVVVGWGVPRWRREALALLCTHRRAVVTVEVVTLVVFAAVLALRAAVPDLWFHPSGGEKPFETAFFTSVARTSKLPPGDPWYSGGAMNYYYGGWFSMAVPTRLLGIPPEVALNLAIATAASLVGAASFSVGSALGALGRRVRDVPRTGLLAGLLAVGSLLVLGNLDTLRRLPDGMGEFDWWAVSRLNPSTTDINEFPAWSVLFGDAHPHLLALPVLIVVVAALVAYVARPCAALAVLVGVGLAWVRIGHTWDLPVLTVLTVAAVLLGAARATGDTRQRYLRALGHLLAVGIVATVVARPYVRVTEVFDRGFTLAAARTPPVAFLVQYGIPLAIVGLFLGRAALRARRSGRLSPVLGSPGILAGAMAIAAGAVVVATGLRGPVVGLALVVVAATLVSAVADLRSGRLGRGLAASLVAAGVGLAALPEVLVVINDLGRQNTVFKFGYTAWVLIALGSAAMAADLVATGSSGRVGWLRAAVVMVVVPGLLFWPAVVPTRVDARFAPLGPTLDGRAWLHHGPVEVEANGVPSIDVTADEPLIGWLRAHGRNGETLVEATGPPYTWVGRISVATGLPTVIGWTTHETQQRRVYADTIDQRAAAVDDLYRMADDERARRILATYRPAYVVVGTVEHALGDPAAIEGLAELPGLDPAFSDGDAVIYRVDLQRIDRELARMDATSIRAGADGGSD